MDIRLYAPQLAAFIARLYRLLPRKQLSLLFLPFSFVTYLLSTWQAFFLILALPPLCLAFLCSIQKGRVEGFLILFLLANLAVILLSPLIDERDHLLALLGIDFAVLTSVLVVFRKRQSDTLDDSLRSMKIAPVLFVGLLSLYFIYGWISGNGLAASAAYLRLYLFPFLFFVLGAFAKGDTLAPVFRAVFLLALSLLAFEYFHPESFYRLTGMADYYSLKMSTVYTPESLAERNMRNFLNLEAFPDIQIYRPLGMLGHPISTAYLFLFFTLWFFCRKQYLLCVIGFSASLVFGVKGVLFATALLVSFEILYRAKLRRKALYWSIFLMVIVYVVAVFLIGFFGFHIINPHMLSLAGALYHIPDNLIGGGLGFGGSMSHSQVPGPQFSDSVLATGISQLGLAGIIIVYTFYLSLVRRAAIPHLSDTVTRLAFFYSLALLANSVFQEEGFSPYALGLALFLLAYSLAKKREQGSATCNQLVDKEAI